MFPLIILLSAIVILTGFLHFTHNLTEAVLSNQWRVYQLNTAYYRSQSQTESNSKRNQHNSDFAHLLDTTAQSPFFKKLRSVDAQLNSALHTLETEVATLAESPEQADHDSIQASLSILQEYIETHIDRQLFTIRMSNNATGFALLLLMGLIVYLYYRNNLYLNQLEKALEDKDFLIKEIHHRVKNNLAMINSFINLQSDKIENSGHPFPEDLNIKTVSSLGLILIQNLVQQLRGSLTLDRKPDTRFTITFPYT